MGLIQNGYRDRGTSEWYSGITASNGAYPAAHHNITHLTGRNRNLTAGEGITNDKVGVPVGATHPVAWILPQNPGLISARAQAISIVAQGLALAGYPIEGETTITVSIADADGQLISSGQGTAAIVVETNNPLLTASISGEGEAEFSVTTNTPTLGAEASLIATSAIVFGGSLVPYAIGSMAGTTIDSGVLTAQGVAAAVLDAAANSPIYANIKQVNGVTVYGTGQASEPWGP